jgi:hypothetical protein
MNNLPPPLPSSESNLTNAKVLVKAPPPLQAQSSAMPPPLMPKSNGLPPPVASSQHRQTELDANKSKTPIFLIGLVIAVVISAGGYFYFKNKNLDNQKSNPEMSLEDLDKLTKKFNDLKAISESSIADTDEKLKAAIRDGFSDEATAWLKQHPAAAKCVEEMVQASQKQQKKEGYEPSTSSETYGDFIGTCNKKINSTNSNLKPRKMLGDEEDKNPNAQPNTLEDKRNKEAKKAWQDNSGFVHFPDGSVTSTSVD